LKEKERTKFESKVGQEEDLDLNCLLDEVGKELDKILA
jgi:hypothetical protein